MPIELTHEQAAMMRSTMHIEELHKQGLIQTIGPGLSFTLSDKGREALAAYDAKWCIVPRAAVKEIVEANAFDDGEGYRSMCATYDAIDSFKEALGEK